MALPYIILVGNLCADPDLRFTPNGKAVVKLRVACSDRKRNADTGLWEDTGTTFLDVTAWRAAEQITEQLKRGDNVHIVGSLKQRQYTAKDGTERVTYEVTAETVARTVKDGTTTPVATTSVGTNWDTDTAWTTNGEAPF